MSAIFQPRAIRAAPEPPLIKDVTVPSGPAGSNHERVRRGVGQFDGGGSSGQAMRGHHKLSDKALSALADKLGLSALSSVDVQV